MIIVPSYKHFKKISMTFNLSIILPHICLSVVLPFWQVFLFTGVRTVAYAYFCRGKSRRVWPRQRILYKTGDHSILWSVTYCVCVYKVGVYTKVLHVILVNITCGQKVEGGCTYMCSRAGDVCGSVGMAVDRNFAAIGREWRIAESCAQLFCVSRIQEWYG